MKRLCHDKVNADSESGKGSVRVSALLLELSCKFGIISERTVLGENGCMYAESLCCPPETTITLLTGYTLI